MIEILFTTSSQVFTVVVNRLKSSVETMFSGQMWFVLLHPEEHGWIIGFTICESIATNVFFFLLPNIAS